MGQSAMDGVFTNQCFAGTCGGTHHHRMALIQSANGLQLEFIQWEWEKFPWIQGGSTVGRGASGGIHR